MSTFPNFLKKIAAGIALAVLCISCSRIPTLATSPWEMVQLPTSANFQDLTFTGNPDRGWLVGSETAIFETTDGGKNWSPRKLQLDSDRYRFNSISFSGDEGWIVGQPSLLLHTNNGGSSWERLALSSKLPGNPFHVLATGKNGAEMATDVGAIYSTQDGGKNWKALVNDAVGVVRTMTRSPNGEYVAVSSKGNFYSTWKPGDSSWSPHNRNSSRRISTMGFTSDDRLWMLARGGQLQYTEPADRETWQAAQFPAQKTSWGLLDLVNRTPDELWLSGGGGTLLRSDDAGKTWQQDTIAENVPSNLYKIQFFPDNRGFIIGQRGILLRYQGA
jgi:photosystem II stability/assembly factor-like uncharacterized protein